MRQTTKAISIATITLLMGILCCPLANAVDVKVRGNFDAPSVAPPDRPSFTPPLVLYLFASDAATEKALNDMNTRDGLPKDEYLPVPKGVPLPMYLGYVAVDKDYVYRFASTGPDSLIPEMLPLLEQLNSIEHRAKYLDKSQSDEVFVDSCSRIFQLQGISTAQH